MICRADTIGATVETVAPVLDVRIVNDKFTGQPRGFAFVHFVSIADATRALHAFNVRSPVAALIACFSSWRFLAGIVLVQRCLLHQLASAQRRVATTL